MAAAEWRAKHLLLAAAALVVGLGLGGLAPRGEIRGLRAQLAVAADRGDCDRDVGRQIATVFRGRPWEGESPDPALAPDPDPDPDPDPEMGPEPTPDRPAEDAAEIPEESLDVMRDAMDLRHTQARAALAQQAGATDEQLAEIDAVVADMNEELRAIARDAVDRFRESGGEPERRDLMVFAADTLDVLIGAEDGIFAALGDDQRDGLADEALDPLSYVDPSIVDVLAELDRR